MKREPTSAGRRRALRMLSEAAAFAVAMACFIWPARAAEAVIQPGEAAPAFTLTDLDGHARALNAATSGTTLLVFLKPDEKFTSETLTALDHMIAHVPEFRTQLRRWIIVSRYDSPAQVKRFAALLGPRKGEWAVLADEGDKLYKSYRIIATPTLVAVGGGKVKAVHPGYDTGLEESVRIELAAAMGIKLPLEMTQPPEKPNMKLQMGRQMAARGLWDRALEYYTQAEAAGPLGDAPQVEKARILTEIGRYDDAIAILQKIAATSSAAKDAAAALARAQALKAGKAVPAPAATPAPPKVTR